MRGEQIENTGYRFVILTHIHWAQTGSTPGVISNFPSELRTDLSLMSYTHYEKRKHGYGGGTPQNKITSVITDLS